MGDASKTAERFLPDPFGRIPGGRIYRTGDVGKVYEDGSFLLAGRTDQQVKLRGHRIELGDIEAHLNRAPGVQTGVVIKKVFSPDDERLIAFMVVAPGAKIEIPSVREFLRARLPEYMLPAEFYVVSVLPLTANGKINRKALDAPERRENIPEKTNGLKTDLEAKIALIWKEALRRDEVSADENFFDIGGHSLLMVQIHHKLQDMTGMSFPLIRMLEHPSIRSLSSYLDGSQQQAISTNELRAEKQRKAFKVQRDRTRAMREPSGVN
jgi:acyl carrier protein